MTRCFSGGQDDLDELVNRGLIERLISIVDSLEIPIVLLTNGSQTSAFLSFEGLALSKDSLILSSLCNVLEARVKNVASALDTGKPSIYECRSSSSTAIDNLSPSSSTNNLTTTSGIESGTKTVRSSVTMEILYHLHKCWTVLFALDKVLKELPSLANSSEFECHYYRNLDGRVIESLRWIVEMCNREFSYIGKYLDDKLRIFLAQFRPTVEVSRRSGETGQISWKSRAKASDARNGLNDHEMWDALVLHSLHMMRNLANTAWHQILQMASPSMMVTHPKEGLEDFVSWCHVMHRESLRTLSSRLRSTISQGHSRRTDLFYLYLTLQDFSDKLFGTGRQTFHAIFAHTWIMEENGLTVLFDVFEFCLRKIPPPEDRELRQKLSTVKHTPGGIHQLRHLSDGMVCDDYILCQGLAIILRLLPRDHIIGGRSSIALAKMVPSFDAMKLWMTIRDSTIVWIKRILEDRLLVNRSPNLIGKVFELIRELLQETRRRPKTQMPRSNTTSASDSFRSFRMTPELRRIAHERRRIRVDQADVDRLCELGFPRSAAEYALRRNHNSLDAAADYLLNHPEIIDDPPSASRDESTFSDSPVEEMLIDDIVQTFLDAAQGGTFALGDHRSQAQAHAAEDSELSSSTTPAPTSQPSLDPDFVLLLRRYLLELLMRVENIDLNMAKTMGLVYLVEDVNGNSTMTDGNEVTTFTSRWLDGAFSGFWNKAIQSPHDIAALVAGNRCCHVLAMLLTLPEWTGEVYVFLERRIGDVLPFLKALPIFHEPDKIHFEGLLHLWFQLLRCDHTNGSKGKSDVVMPDRIREFRTNLERDQDIRYFLMMFSVRLVESFAESIDTSDRVFDLPEASRAALQLLAFLSRDHDMTKFISRNLVEVLLNLTRRSPISESSHAYAIHVLRHVYEHPAFIRYIMSCQIHSIFLEPRPKLTLDVRHFSRSVVPTLLRDNRLARECLEALCEPINYDQATKNCTLRIRTDDSREVADNESTVESTMQVTVKPYRCINDDASKCLFERAFQAKDRLFVTEMEGVITEIMLNAFMEAMQTFLSGIPVVLYRDAFATMKLWGSIRLQMELMAEFMTSFPSFRIRAIEFFQGVSFPITGTESPTASAPLISYFRVFQGLIRLSDKLENNTTHHQVHHHQKKFKHEWTRAWITLWKALVGTDEDLLGWQLCTHQVSYNCESRRRLFKSHLASLTEVLRSEASSWNVDEKCALLDSVTLMLKACIIGESNHDAPSNIQHNPDVALAISDSGIPTRLLEETYYMHLEETSPASSTLLEHVMGLLECIGQSYDALPHRLSLSKDEGSVSSERHAPMTLSGITGSPSPGGALGMEFERASNEENDSDQSEDDMGTDSEDEDEIDDDYGDGNDDDDVLHSEISESNSFEGYEVIIPEEGSDSLSYGDSQNSNSEDMMEVEDDMIDSNGSEAEEADLRVVTNDDDAGDQEDEDDEDDQEEAVNESMEDDEDDDNPIDEDSEEDLVDSMQTGNGESDDDDDQDTASDYFEDHGPSFFTLNPEDIELNIEGTDMGNGSNRRAIYPSSRREGLSILREIDLPSWARQEDASVIVALSPGLIRREPTSLQDPFLQLISADTAASSIVSSSTSSHQNSLLVSDLFPMASASAATTAGPLRLDTLLSATSGSMHPPSGSGAYGTRHRHHVELDLDRLRPELSQLVQRVLGVAGDGNTGSSSSLRFSPSTDLMTPWNNRVASRTLYQRWSAETMDCHDPKLHVKAIMDAFLASYLPRLAKKKHETDRTIEQSQQPEQSPEDESSESEQPSRPPTASPTETNLPGFLATPTPTSIALPSPPLPVGPMSSMPTGSPSIDSSSSATPASNTVAREHVINTLGIDPGFLESLPDDVRRDTIMSIFQAGSHGDHHHHPNFMVPPSAFVHPEFLAALSENVRREVLEQHRMVQQHQERTRDIAERFHDRMPQSMRSVIGPTSSVLFRSEVDLDVGQLHGESPMALASATPGVMMVDTTEESRSGGELSSSASRAYRLRSDWHRDLPIMKHMCSHWTVACFTPLLMDIHLQWCLRFLADLEISNFGPVQKVLLQFGTRFAPEATVMALLILLIRGVFFDFDKPNQNQIDSMIMAAVDSVASPPLRTTSTRRANGNHVILIVQRCLETLLAIATKSSKITNRPFVRSILTHENRSRILDKELDHFAQSPKVLTTDLRLVYLLDSPILKRDAMLLDLFLEMLTYLPWDCDLRCHVEQKESTSLSSCTPLVERLVVAVCCADPCPTTRFDILMKILRKWIDVPVGKEPVAKALVGCLLLEINELTPLLDLITTSLRRVSEDEELHTLPIGTDSEMGEQQSLVPTTSKRSIQWRSLFPDMMATGGGLYRQTNLLRLLKLSRNLHEVIRPKMDILTPHFDRLWIALSTLLSLIEENRDSQQWIPFLAPLVESFIVYAHLLMISLNGGGSEAASSSQEETVVPVQIRKIIGPFLEKHRKSVNYLLRNDPSSLLSTFSLLTLDPKWLDFDNKKTFFYQQLHKREEPRASGISNLAATTAGRAESMTTTSTPGPTVNNAAETTTVPPMPSTAGNTGSTGPTIPISLNVRRDRVFEDSYLQLNARTGEELKYGRLSVRFRGEEGVDAGGLTREWFSVLVRHMFNPDYALFTRAAVGTSYQPNRTSYVNPDHLYFFKFVGRILGKAIYDRQLLDSHFVRPVYKQLLGIPVDLNDMESVDPEYHKSLLWMLNNDITSIVDHAFSAEVDEFGQLKTIDLIPDGRNISVVEENKRLYVQLTVHLKLVESIKQQMDSFRSGFHEIVPADLVRIFNENELELLVSGMPDIDVDDWRNNTLYEGYMASSPQIQWFWRALRSFSNEERAKLVQFVTGTSKVPLEGFAALHGSNGVHKFHIHRDYGSPNRLPSAHTCFNQLDLPAYESYEQLKDALLMAIQECNTGFGFM